MKNFGFTFLVCFLAILSACPVIAQTGQVARKKNLFGNYVYLQDDQRMSEKEFLNKMQTNPEASNLMRDARKNKVWGSVIGSAGGALFGAWLGAQFSLKSN